MSLEVLMQLPMTYVYWRTGLSLKWAWRYAWVMGQLIKFAIDEGIDLQLDQPANQQKLADYFTERFRQKYWTVERQAEILRELVEAAGK